MFNAFDDLFAPGRKHTRDEQNRLELTREDVGDGDPGRGPIDLTSGKVVVRPPKPEEPDEPEDLDEPDETDEPGETDEPAAAPNGRP